MTIEAPDDGDHATIYEPRLWQDRGWTARVIKNNDDDGWAVEMLRQGESEPALVGPWTMGRDKKNPKPLDTAVDSAQAVKQERRSARIAHNVRHGHGTAHSDSSARTSPARTVPLPSRSRRGGAPLPSAGAASP